MPFGVTMQCQIFWLACLSFPRIRLLMSLRFTLHYRFMENWKSPITLTFSITYLLKIIFFVISINRYSALNQLQFEVVANCKLNKTGARFKILLLASLEHDITWLASHFTFVGDKLQFVFLTIYLDFESILHFTSSKLTWHLAC